MKRLISLLLCFVMVCSMVGCGGSKSSGKRKDIDITFPLEEELTITFMVRGVEDSNFKTKIAENKLFKRIKEETKATIRCIPLDGDKTPGFCMVTGKPSAQRVIFARNY